MDRVVRDLILLNMLQDIGYIRLSALLERFQTTEAIFNASLSSLKTVEGIGEKIAESIKSARTEVDIDKELSLIDKFGVKVITVFEEDYPANLKTIYDPPIVLYVKGKLIESDKIAVAIVGSRRCTQYGIRTAQRLAGELAVNGVCVLSGLARGIDTAAHKGAVNAGGRTIAVLGNGLSSIYPSENKKLADEIIKNGAVISEFAMEMPPHKENFPRRNRVISGLSKGVVVVEAARKSGALITVDFALEQGRDVFSVPGACDAVTSAGTNRLIKEGAKLVQDAADILEELGISSKKAKKELPALTDYSEKEVYSILSDNPQNIDEIIDAISIGPSQVRFALVNLEMKGVIKQLRGKFYVRA